MKIQKIVGGPVPTNCYILTDGKTGQTAVIDPGFESRELDEAVAAAGADRIRAVLLTHAHFDHITGVARIREKTGAKVYLHESELTFVTDGSLNGSDVFFVPRVAPFGVDVPLGDGDEIGLGSLSVRVIHTPGHTRGGCSFLVGGALFTGDTLMKLSCGRTDLPTGSWPEMTASLRRLAKLPGDYHLYPGHGPESTLGFERKNNPFLGENA